MSAHAIVHGHVVPLGAGTTYTHSTVAVGTTSTLLVAAHPDRVALVLQNISTVDIWLNLTGAAATAQAGVQLPSGGTLSMCMADFDLTRTAIYAIHAGTGTHNVLVSEGTV